MDAYFVKCSNVHDQAIGEHTAVARDPSSLKAAECQRLPPFHEGELIEQAVDRMEAVPDASNTISVAH